MSNKSPKPPYVRPAYLDTPAMDDPLAYLKCLLDLFGYLDPEPRERLIDEWFEEIHNSCSAILKHERERKRAAEDFKAAPKPTSRAQASGFRLIAGGAR
jgi:hypothetical protein